MKILEQDFHNSTKLSAPKLLFSFSFRLRIFLLFIKIQKSYKNVLQMFFTSARQTLEKVNDDLLNFYSR